MSYDSCMKISSIYSNVYIYLDLFIFIFLDIFLVSWKDFFATSNLF